MVVNNVDWTVTLALDAKTGILKSKVHMTLDLLEW